METVSTLFLIWWFHAAVGFALSAPILFLGRKRIGFAAWQWLALILPFCVWVLLMLSPLASDRKTLANLGEPIYISFAMPVLALIRIAVGARMSEKFHATTFLAALSGIAAGIFFTVPSLPE